ncbi:uncharacterized protein M6B38_362660 [Iris pallida]|uniref:Uncharacterized protein n=2 Tax=Iris pallida TaxID=29817 RepID=A0AAX6GIQ7_IRIPA|nr:uncharacterized protein M6B38_362660 [Iris pallida]
MVSIRMWIVDKVDFWPCCPEKKFRWKIAVVETPSSIRKNLELGRLLSKVREGFRQDC